MSSLPEEILKEILSRLPVKSVLQCKSVCKHWLSLIIDPQFIDLHSKRSKSRPNIIYINPLKEERLLQADDGSESLQQSISCAEMVEGSGGQEQDVEAISSKVKITDDKWFLYDQVLEPVNSLFCFVDKEAYAIKVYNASTREVTPWYRSTLIAEENDKLEKQNSQKEMKSLGFPNYQFGFDPEKREHKVFCFWRLKLADRFRRRQPHSGDPPDYECLEVLTVGRDTKWRRINAVPNESNQIKIKQAHPLINNFRPRVYADGTIYWSNKEYYWDGRRSSNADDPAVIVAFDVGSETYRVIPIPNFILEEPRDERLPMGMLVLGGHIALLYWIETGVVKLWMLDDRDEQRLENCRGNISNWSSETITLPFWHDERLHGFGIAGCSDKILFQWMGYENSEGFVRLYSYDRGKKTLKKIEMDGVSRLTLRSWESLVATFTESLYPVPAS